MNIAVVLPCHTFHSKDTDHPILFGLLSMTGIYILGKQNILDRIKYVEENATKEGLTDEVMKWFEENKK